MNRSLFLSVAVLPFASAIAQINTGSNGSDGAFNPTQSITVDMSDHPDGIYQYISVNIPTGVTVNFKANSANTPVTWLVQGDCIISGTISNYAFDGGAGGVGGAGGAGGWAGGNGGSNPTPGQGPGGGSISAFTFPYAGGAGSFGTVGTQPNSNPAPAAPGATYGNIYLIPLLGGSGGGGLASCGGGGGGGGAVLIAASGTVSLNGYVNVYGGAPPLCQDIGSAGGGSGGALRIIATTFGGTGTVNAYGGPGPIGNSGGFGRIRVDAFNNAFGGTFSGNTTVGFQPIIIPAPGQGVQLNIQTVAGNAVAANPSGVLANPDVIVPAQTTNPVSIVVGCTNIPLSSEITVTVNPANGSAVQAVGLNAVGNSSASTATVSLNLPTGGGIIYASAVTGINGGTSASTSAKNTTSYAKTGLATNGERFDRIETKAALGGRQQQTLITPSGKRYPLPGN